MPETSWREMITFWQSFTTVWSEAMGRVCLSGTLALLAAFMFTRLFRRTQAGVRCWIWRLALLKFCLAGFALPPLALSVLNVSNTVSATRGSVATAPLGKEAGKENAPTAAALSVENEVTAHAAGFRSPAAVPEKAAFPRIWSGLLLGLWGSGVGIGFVRIVRQYRDAKALVRAACPLTDAAVRTELIAVSRALHLPRSPDLRVSDLTDVPFLCGVLRPVVILPAKVVTDFAPQERRMMLAHELAHAKRHDLVWCLLAGVAQALFFFHPLIWWANRELRMTQEICCDEQAIQCSAVSAHAYGEVLVRIAVKQASFPQDGPVAVAMAETFHSIPRRLEEMQTFSVRTGWKRWMPALAVAVGGAALLPWQLKAQDAGLFPEVREQACVPCEPEVTKRAEAGGRSYR